MRRRLLGVMIAFAMAFAFGGGAYVFALDDEQFGGSTADGSHEWWPVTGDVNEVFCTRCHSTLVEDLEDGRHVVSARPDQGQGQGLSTAAMSECSFCHAPSDDGHVAAETTCGSCHVEQATALATDSHAGMLEDLGETGDPEQASWTCMACHTHVAIEMTTAPMDPLPLHMEPPVVP